MVSESEATRTLDMLRYQLQDGLSLHDCNAVALSISNDILVAPMSPYPEVI